MRPLCLFTELNNPFSTQRSGKMTRNLSFLQSETLTDNFNDVLQSELTICKADSVESSTHYFILTLNKPAPLKKEKLFCHETSWASNKFKKYHQQKK